jgi:hypothetical protein
MCLIKIDIKGENNMNELECRNEHCEEVVTCEEGVVNVTCSYCCATMGVCND